VPWLGPPLAVLSAWLLARAWLLPGRGLVPRQVGVLEIVNSLLLLVAIVLTWA
jgi:hypothetical protein